MARIPLSQIPNAPQIVQGPVLTNPNAIRVPDIQRSARSLIQPTMAQGSFDGPAKGLQSLGAGVGSLGASIEKVAPRVSAVLRHFAQAKEQAQDLISLTTQRERQVAAVTERLQGAARGRMADDFEAEQPFDMQAEMTEASRTRASALFPWMDR